MTTSKPKILLVNDDGIHAEGLRFLWEALKECADPVIVAPSREQSGAGASITMRQPLHLVPVPWPEKGAAYSVSGTPADCVKMALTALLQTPPDLIISGINAGSNSGRNIFYSGTVGGAIEGALQEIPSMAISCWDHMKPNFEPAAKQVPSLIEFLLNHPLPKGTILNVNFPVGEPKGFRMTRQGHAYWKEEPDKRQHPDGFPYYWLAGRNIVDNEPEDTDVGMLVKGYATAVPVQITELTNDATLASHGSPFADYFE